MSEPSASDILKKMREDRENGRKAGGSIDKLSDKESFYPRLIIFKLRRRQLTLALAFSFCVVLAILAGNFRSEKSWWVRSLPIVVVGLIISVIPLSEEWEYKPWQAKARQYERHQIER